MGGWYRERNEGGRLGGDGRGRALGIRCFPQALSGCSKETNRLGERLFRASTLGSDRPSLSVFFCFFKLDRSMIGSRFLTVVLDPNAQSNPCDTVWMSVSRGGGLCARHLPLPPTCPASDDSLGEPRHPTSPSVRCVTHAARQPDHPQ